MTGRTMERVLWTVALVAAVLVAAIAARRAADERARTRDLRTPVTRAAALETRVVWLESQAAALRDSLARLAARVPPPALPEPEDVAALRRRGLTDPVPQLRSDLMAHRDLIPYPGVLGGTMAFHDPSHIYVLDDHWVLATFDDGHVQGRMLLEYAVRNGRIAWRRLAARMES